MDTDSPLQKENMRKKKSVLDSEEGTFAIRSRYYCIMYIQTMLLVCILTFFGYSVMYIHDLHAICFN